MGHSTALSVIVVLHPGEMGASVGAALRGNGHEVRWVRDGRSAATHRRAEDAGLTEIPSLADAIEGADVVVSVCPPSEASTVAAAVAAAGFAGTYLDANAVSPATARGIAAAVAGGGARPVDGGIIGPPARRPGTTRLYLSGEGTDDMAALFAGSALDPRVIDGGDGAASALKVAYAAWTKGGSALLLAIAAFADVEGVTEGLHSEWAISQPDLADRLALTVAGVAPKAWRFEGELADSAAAFVDVGLPDGFGAASAEIYGRLARFKDGATPSIDEVVAALLDLG